MGTLDQKQPERGHGPVFVVGMWRSGTSLFYALLNQHSQVKLMYEDELPVLWPLFLGGRGKSDWRERWEFWNQAPSRHKLKVEDLPAEVSGLREACEATWNLYAGDATIRGCKSPNYFDCLPRLANAFPDARFIVIWRDPADVCRSVVRAQSDSFFAKRGMVLRALLGCHELKRGYDTLIARGAQVYPVQYEDLIADPAAVMQGVCSFLDIAFERRMVSLRGADRSAIYEGGHHQLVNSEKIVAGKKKPEVLPEDIHRKVANYIAVWKKESDGSWPRYSEPSAANPGLLFFFERVAEGLFYRSLRLFDELVALMYCYLPLDMLRNYRASKHHAAAAAHTSIAISDNSAKELVGAQNK